jgi:uncharacterized SAM-binding protein YcdF (DUF218 family)
LEASRRRSLFFVAAVLIGVAILVWSQSSEIGHWAFVRLEQRFPPWRNSSNRPIAGVISLGGSFNGLRSPGARFEASVRLAETFRGAKVVFSGREETAGGADARAALIAGGIEPDRIAVDERSANTAENAAFSAALLKPKKGDRWILVTSAFHMPRAIGAFRKAGFAVEAYPVEHLSVSHHREAQTALKEILGLIYYRITGRSDSLYPAP